MRLPFQRRVRACINSTFFFLHLFLKFEESGLETGFLGILPIAISMSDDLKVMFAIPREVTVYMKILSLDIAHEDLWVTRRCLLLFS